MWEERKRERERGAVKGSARLAWRLHLRSVAVGNEALTEVAGRRGHLDSGDRVDHTEGGGEGRRLGRLITTGNEYKVQEKQRRSQKDQERRSGASGLILERERKDSPAAIRPPL